MTTLPDAPGGSASVGIHSLELEITGKCQLACAHCLSQSSPQATHGAMTPANWREVITDAAGLGIRSVQLIGGEPTVHPYWRDMTDLGLSLGLHVEVYSNLFHVAPDWWEVFAREGVTLGTSYYSDDAEEHDKITGRTGSYARTRSNILEAVARGITVRAGIVDVLPGQRVSEARAELASMGVRRIHADRVRAVGRAAILPDGNLAGCVLSRDFPAGNVREARLAELFRGEAWAGLAARIPARVTAECNPNKDGEDCAPAENEACEPAYD